MSESLRKLEERIKVLEEFHAKVERGVEVAERLSEIFGDELDEWVTERETEVKELKERVSILEERMQH